MSTTTIFAVIVAVSNAIVAVFGYMLAMHNANNDKDAKKEKKEEEAKKHLEDVCNNGTVSDLIDAAKKLGEAKR